MARKVKGKGGGTPSQVRIIGGRWRGRRLPVPDLPDLRPSPDRLRETLFNWLGPQLAGARCLDLYAGTGALGLEAASRGAARVELVEYNTAAAAQLRKTVAELGADQVEVFCADALSWLAAREAPFDIVFVDPPFRAGIWDAAVRALAARLEADALVYVESPAEACFVAPPEFTVHREKDFASVRASLLKRL